MKIAEKVAKLIDVKSIVTLVLTGIFSYLAVANVIDGGEFLSIFTVVIAFYFGTQSTKVTEKKEDTK